MSHTWRSAHLTSVIKPSPANSLHAHTSTPTGHAQLLNQLTVTYALGTPSRLLQQQGERHWATRFSLQTTRFSLQINLHGGDNNSEHDPLASATRRRRNPAKRSPDFYVRPYPVVETHGRPFYHALHFRTHLRPNWLRSDHSSSGHGVPRPKMRGGITISPGPLRGNPGGR